MDVDFTPKIIKPKRRRFNQSTILEYFKARCADCGTRANLTTHHKNSDPSDVSLENLEILCIHCHRKREGIDKKKRDLK